MWGRLVRLFDLELLRDADPDTLTLRWQLPWPHWVVWATGALAVVFIALTYDRERVAPRTRRILTVLRAAMACVLLLLICRPVLVWERTRTEPSVAMLLVDGSQSMTLRDMPAAGAGPFDEDSPATTTAHHVPAGASADYISRHEALFAALLPPDGEGTPLTGCLQHNLLSIHRFGQSLRAARTVSDEAKLTKALADLRDIEPADPATDVAGAVDAALNEARTGRLSAIVLATDGRATVPTDYRHAIEAARRRNVPVFPILLGSAVPPVDLEDGPLLADEVVFVKDILAVRGTLLSSGGPAGEVTLRLTEDGREEPLAEQRLAVSGRDESLDFEFSIRPYRAGRHRYRVVAEERPGELTAENNGSAIEITAIEDKIRVLYVESAPRFEYRYLKNTLLREPTIVSSVLLLDADNGFAQEGTAPITRFPQTEDELFEYDILILGDIDVRRSGKDEVGWLTPQRIELIVDFVARRGGGIMFVAGQRGMPHTLSGTELEKLLPVMIDTQAAALAGSQPAAASGRAFRLEPTPEGWSAPVFRFGADAELNREIVAALPPLYWYAATLGPKPAAEILAQHPTDRALNSAMPLIVVGRYGAGRTYFHGTDDTWMWRRGTGEGFYDTYWLQAIRYCAENRLITQSRSARLTTDRREYDFGQPVKVTLQLVSGDLADSLPNEIEVRASETERGHVETLRLSRLGPRSRNYEGTLTPPGPGGYTITCELPSPTGAAVRPHAQFLVRTGSPELATRSADHERLVQMAEQTGGRVLLPHQLAELPALLPDRSVRIPDDVAQPIWDSGLFLWALVLILSIEWFLRKRAGLI